MMIANRRSVTLGLTAVLILATPTPASADAERAFVVKPRIAESRDGITVYVKEVLSEVLGIDRVYPSRHGPSGQTKLTLGEPGDPPELLWLVGYASTLTEADGVTPVSSEFMCNSTLSILRANLYRRDLPTAMLQDLARPRVFSLAQAQMSIELPEGFAVPMLSDQLLGINAQVLDHNGARSAFEVRQRLRIAFLRDSELEHAPIPLMARSIAGMQLVAGPDCYPGYSSEQVETRGYGPGCLSGTAAAAKHVTSDGFGRELTNFWIVPPGHELNRTPVTNSLALPYDTTVHYIAAELHPFAVSLTLRDLTNGKTVWESRARPTQDRIGLAEVDHFSSREGLPLYRDHEYELVSVYDNPTRNDHTAMARLLLYVRASDLDEATLRPPDGWAAAEPAREDAR